HTTTLPDRSVIVTCVLLNVALMCATPSASTLRRARFGRAPFLAFAIPPYSLSGIRATLLLRRLLLAGDRTTDTLVCPRVRMRALTTDRQTTAMPQTTIAPDIHQALHIHRDLGPERTLHLHRRLDR